MGLMDDCGMVNIEEAEMIPVFKPLIQQEEIDACQEALTSGWLGIGSYMGQGSYVQKFEESIAKVINAPDRFVSCVSTGHAALHLSLLIAGVVPGDEVITPSLNNIADLQAILATGAVPVFCDVDDMSLCIDLSKAADLITPRSKAVIVMDYACMLCDHTQVAEFAQKYNLRVIHDAAHSFGAKYQSKAIGSFSDICMFSFDAAKALTCIDGGALVVRSEDDLSRIHEMRLLGKAKPYPTGNNLSVNSTDIDIRQVGYRYHLANPHAAIGLAQIAKLKKISETRCEAGRYYNQKLRDIDDILIPQTDFTDVVPFVYYIRVKLGRRAALQAHLKEMGVSTEIHWTPGHNFTLFKEYRKGNLSVTEMVSQEILSLPLHSLMSSEIQDKVITGIRAFFGK